MLTTVYKQGKHKPRVKKPPLPLHKLTQEERLEEAKETARINTLSLQEQLRLEEEKKKIVLKKKRYGK